LRAVRHLGSDALAAVREGVRRVDLIAIDDRILDAAGILEPRVLRTLDAIHLATALAVGDDLDAVLTYDERMIEAARLLGLLTASPR
jgi:predicted nucleic acid-binding protein